MEQNSPSDASPDPLTSSGAPLPETVRFDPASRSPGAWVFLIAVTLTALLIDLSTKHAAFRWVADAPVNVRADEVLAAGPARLDTLLPAHPPIVVIPHLLEFKLVLNAGAVFGAGQGKRYVFMGFTFLALGFALWMFARWTDRRERLAHGAIALLLAGGLGNLYDRVVYACVRDFLHPLPTAKLPFGLAWPSGDRMLWPYVSNVADAFLILGIAVLVVKLWKGDR